MQMGLPFTDDLFYTRHCSRNFIWAKVFSPHEGPMG